MQRHLEGWSSEAFVLVQVPEEGDAKMESDTQSHWGGDTGEGSRREEK